MFLFHSRDWKKVQLAGTFFQSLVNDDVKVNKTQKMSSKIDLEFRLIVWFLIQLISRSETQIEDLEFAVEQSWKEKAKKTFICALKNLESF